MTSFEKNTLNGKTRNPVSDSPKSSLPKHFDKAKKWMLFTLVILLSSLPVASGTSPHASETKEHLETISHPKPAEATVNKFEHEVGLLSDLFENRKEHPESVKEIREKAPMLAHQLLAVPEDGMGQKHQILKYQSALTAFVMAAKLETDMGKKRFYADQGIECANTGIYMTRWAFWGEDRESYGWVKDRRTFEYMNDLLDVCYAIRAKTNEPSPAEATVNKFEHEVGLLSDLFENRKEHPESVKEIREKAPMLAKQLLAVPEDGMGLKHRMLKYQSALTAFVMAATLETDMKEKTNYADQGIECAETGICMMWFLGKEKGDQELHRWLENGRRIEYMNYLLSVCHAIKSKTNEPSPAEAAVNKFKHEVGLLSDIFENRKEHPESVREIREKAPMLAKQLLAVPEDGMGQKHRMLKYQSALTAFVMAATLETDTKKKTAYADQGVECAEKGIGERRTGTWDEEESEETVECPEVGIGIIMDRALDNEEHERRIEIMNYLLSACYAIKARTGDESAVEKFETTLRKITEPYRAIYPLENHDLRMFRTSETKENPESLSYSRYSRTQPRLFISGTKENPEPVLHLDPDKKNAPSPAEAAVNKLEHEVRSLLDLFENRKEHPESVKEIRENAPLLAKQLLAVSDDDTGQKHQMLKYQLALTASFMAATLETDMGKKRFYANRGIEYANTGISDMMFMMQDGGRKDQELYEWVVHRQRIEYMNYLLSVCYAIKVQTGDKSAVEKVKRTLAEIPESYKAIYPLENHEVLEWFLGVYSDSPYTPELEPNSDHYRLFTCDGCWAIMPSLEEFRARMTERFKLGKGLSDSEGSMEILRADILSLQRELEGTDGSPESNEITREFAPNLARTILRLSEEDMRQKYRILKYQYALAAFTMAGTVETDTGEKLDYAKQGIECADKCIALMEEVLQKPLTGEEEDQELSEWIEYNRRMELTKYLLSMCHVIKIQSGDRDKSEIESVKKLLTSIPASYKDRYSLEENKVLKWFLEKHSESRPPANRSYGAGGPSLFETKVTLSKTGPYKALVIGIKEYDDKRLDTLENPVKDAKAIAETLGEKYGFEVELLLNAQAGKKAIYHAMRKLVKTTSPDDSVLIYYSGHGGLDRHSEEEKDGWWVPADAIAGDTFTYIENSSVRSHISNMKAKHVLLISDSCYAGTLFGKTRSTPRIEGRLYRELHEKGSRWGMTSGNKHPVSDKGSGGHSVFAYQLLGVLRENRRPTISTQEIFSEIRTVVSNNSEQTPVCRPLRFTGDQGGEFVFVLSQKASG